MTAQNWGKPTVQALEDMILDRLAPLLRAYVSAPRFTGSGLSDFKANGWYTFAAGPHVYKFVIADNVVSPNGFDVYKDGVLMQDSEGINFATGDETTNSIFSDFASGVAKDTGIRISAPGNDAAGGGYTLNDYWEITAGGGPLAQIVAVEHRLDSPEDAIQALADLELSAPVGMLSLADETEGEDAAKAASCRTINDTISGKFAIVLPSNHRADARRMDYWILGAWKMLMARWLPPSSTYPEKLRTFFVDRFPISTATTEDDADMKRISWGFQQVVLGGSTRDWTPNGMARVFDFSVRLDSTPMEL